MKFQTSKTFKALTVTMFLFVFCASISGASDYLGQYCLTATVGNESNESRLAVSSIGGGNYLLNGTSTNSSTSGVGSVIGNAAIVGNKVTMTLHESHTDEHGVSITTGHYDLASSTLAGTFQQISQDYSGGFEPLSHVSGTASLAPCGILFTTANLTGSWTISGTDLQGQHPWAGTIIINSSGVVTGGTIGDLQNPAMYSITGGSLSIDSNGQVNGQMSDSDGITTLLTMQMDVGKSVISGEGSSTHGNEDSLFTFTKQ